MSKYRALRAQNNVETFLGGHAGKQGLGVELPHLRLDRDDQMAFMMRHGLVFWVGPGRRGVMGIDDCRSGESDTLSDQAVQGLSGVAMYSGFMKRRSIRVVVPGMGLALPRLFASRSQPAPVSAYARVEARSLARIIHGGPGNGLANVA